MTARAPVLTVRNLSMTFPGQRALSEVSLDVLAGEVHALVGENGSGKSTLIKCLAGVNTPDPGAAIEVSGRPLDLPYTSPQALAYGFGFVHQNLGLVPTLTVRENIALSRGFKTAGGRIKWSWESRRAAELLDSLGAEISPSAVVGSLSQAQRTLVAIARALQSADAGGKVLVLDEPTAALPSEEVESLFAVIRRVASLGVGIIYVSHRLGEIFEIADRVTVLRDARRVGTFDIRELDEAGLVEQIIGRRLEAYYPDVADTATDHVLLRVSGLSGRRVKDASFTVRHGEIVGVAGLLASGRSELARLIFGAQRATAGEIELDGRVLRGHDPRKAVEAGIAFVPEDRRHGGSHPSLTLAENLTLGNLRAHTSWGRVRRSSERREVLELIDRFDVRPRQPGKKFQTFSGGNQQKAILAKWLRLEPRLLILDEPVQGVDIGSTTDIYKHIEAAAAAGMGVLMIDSEISDLCHLCDRILVMRDGRILRVLEGADKTRDRILELTYTGAAA
jgi:ribose transport system ATP-binding protein